MIVTHVALEFSKCGLSIKTKSLLLFSVLLRGHKAEVLLGIFMQRAKAQKKFNHVFCATFLVEKHL